MEILENNVEVSVANYYSDAVPPQIGSIIDPTAFVDEPLDDLYDYKVVQVISTPGNENPPKNIATSTYVKILVKKNSI
jgi:hypothetical protein